MAGRKPVFRNLSLVIVLGSWILVLQNVGGKEISRNFVQEEFREEVAGGGKCSCDKELEAVMKRLERLEELVEKKIEKPPEDPLFIEARSTLLVKDLVDIVIRNKTNHLGTNQLALQSDFIQSHILDPKLLSRISEIVWTSLMKQLPETKPEALFQVFQTVSAQAAPSFHVPMFNYLLDYLGALGHLRDQVGTVIDFLKTILVKARTIPSVYWSEEVESKFLRRIIPNVRNWTVGYSWLNSEFFDSFPTLSETEALDLAFEILETESLDTFLNPAELTFVKKMYYASSYFKICRDEDDPTAAQTSPICSQERWSKVFLRPKIRSSIQDEILSKITSNHSDAVHIGLNYFRTWKDLLENENLFLYKQMRDEGSDILMAFAVETFLEAIQDGDMRFNSKDPNLFHFLQILGKSVTVAAKFPFFAQEYHRLVIKKYGATNFTNFESIRGFLQHSDIRYSAPEGIWGFFVDSMRESGRFHGNEIFQFGEMLLDSAHRRNLNLWQELPLPVQLMLRGPAPNISWKVKIHQGNQNNYEYYDIVCHQNYSIGLQSINSSRWSDASSKVFPTKVWKFDKYEPWYAYRRFDAYESLLTGNLATVTIQAPHRSGKGKVVLSRDADHNGSFRLRQSPDFVGPEMEVSSYTVFKPSLDDNLRTFSLSVITVSEHMPMASETFVKVLYDPSLQEPLGLGLTQNTAQKAEFILSRA